MYTVEFVDGPWVGKTYDTDIRSEEIESEFPQDFHGHIFPCYITYKLIREVSFNILQYSCEEVSPQTSQ